MTLKPGLEGNVVHQSEKATNSNTSHAGPVQANVLSRLQALFPTSAASSSPPAQTSESANLPTTVTEAPVLPQAKFLKIRIVTWNMHDSLPKGDLEELLGSVPEHETSQPSDTALPSLSSEPNHPYHIVVIAGQECPTVSGMPMGLGAGFKLMDHHKDKEKDNKDKDKEKDKENLKGKEKEDAKGKEKDDARAQALEPSANYGWTAMIEEWLCSSTCSGVLPTPSPSSNVDSPTHVLALPHNALSSGDPRRNGAGKDQRKHKGLYQMLAKERLMGIYLVLFVHRDIRPLVKGISKSAVTAGLIGGRVGNKGGVGISMNLDGNTFLFINAHLAAHEGKVHHRLANLAKIKAELTVDDFLQPDDPRLMAEDVTDKFDYSFLCGDLNFRLDISRIHADWLISRQEYAQALAFDQLRKVMESGEAFVGFNEAPINFPPTFKYDVLRTIKKKRKSLRKAWRFSVEKLDGLAESEEQERPECEEDEEGGDTASVTSTALVSMQSKRTTEPDEDDVSSKSVRFSTVNLVQTQGAAPASGKLLTSFAALKTALVSPSTPNFFNHVSKRQGKQRPISLPVTPRLLRSKSSTDVIHQGGLGSSPHLLLSTPQDEEDFDRGVYDSSSKKRVPSWCDRILWKSTIVPDTDLDNEHSTFRPRNRVGQWIAMALRPLRGRTPSLMSIMSTSSPEGTATPSEASSLDVSDAATPSKRTPRRAETSPVGKMRSSERLHVYEDLLSESASSDGNPRRRSTSLVASASNSAVKPHRFATIDTPSSNRPKDPPQQPPIWRRLPFLSSQSTSLREGDQNGEGKHRKGDVICLNYTALDDRGMRRLEGRSDHRPVIGSYAVYL